MKPRASNKRNMTGNQLSKNNGLNKEDLKSVFGEFMREEVIKLRTEWEDSLVQRMKKDPRTPRKNAATAIRGRPWASNILHQSQYQRLSS